MALVKFAPLISEVRGAVGQVVFSRNTYSAYVRDRVIPANPNTVAQQTARAFVTTVSQGWSALTEPQRIEWRERAIDFSRKNIFGDETKLSGYNLFCKLNVNRVKLGVGISASPPFFDPPFIIKPSSFVVDTVGVTMVLGWTPAAVATNLLYIYATPGLSTGINFVDSEYRFIKAVTSGTSNDIVTAYVAVFGLFPPAGSKVFVRIASIKTLVGIQSTTHDIFTISV